MSRLLTLAIAVTIAAGAQGAIVPLDFGTTVSGYQDDFTGTQLNPYWTILGANVYSLDGQGLLHVAKATGDPNHLVFQQPGYSQSNQEVLLRIRPTAFTATDGDRGGAAVSVTAGNEGLNLNFRQAGTRHFALLNDHIAWGPTYTAPGSDVWNLNEWYWVRLKHAPDSASGAADLFGKVWLADGSTPEPAEWSMQWNLWTGSPGRLGWAGIAASSGGTSEFDVDYFLVKADGLPQITVGVPEPATMSLLLVGGVLLRRKRG